MIINSLNCCAPCFFGYDSFYTLCVLCCFELSMHPDPHKPNMPWFILGRVAATDQACLDVLKFSGMYVIVYIYRERECVSAFSNHMVVCTYSVYVCFCRMLYLQCMYLMCACMHACNVKSCYVMVRHVTFSNVLLCYVVLCWVVMIGFGLCFVLFRGVMLCYVSVWSAMSCQVTSCYVMICCVRYVCNLCNVHNIMQCNAMSCSLM